MESGSKVGKVLGASTPVAHNDTGTTLLETGEVRVLSDAWGPQNLVRLSLRVQLQSTTELWCNLRLTPALCQQKAWASAYSSKHFQAKLPRRLCHNNCVPMNPNVRSLSVLE